MVKNKTSPQNGRTLQWVQYSTCLQSGWTLQGLIVRLVHEVDGPYKGLIFNVHKVDGPYDGFNIQHVHRVNGPYEG